ncbi:MAG TPA: DUF2294 domain-containing protein [Pyrinomonadaceae bacterium]
MKTKGEIEAEISQAMVKFELEYMGRGPTEVRSFVVEDMILVRLKGVLTQAEQQLAKSSEGVDLIKMLRTTLIKNARPVLFQVIGDICGIQPTSLYTDISAARSERVIVFALESDLEKTLLRKK